MSLDLDRPVHVRKIFEAISKPDRHYNYSGWASVFLDLYGPDVDRAAEALGAFSEIRNRPHPTGWTMWDTASAVYDAVGAPS